MVFNTQAEKDAAIAKEKSIHQTPNPEQVAHLKDLEDAEVK